MPWPGGEAPGARSLGDGPTMAGPGGGMLQEFGSHPFKTLNPAGRSGWLGVDRKSLMTLFSEVYEFPGSHFESGTPIA
jgi:hypothetical protein